MLNPALPPTSPTSSRNPSNQTPDFSVAGCRLYKANRALSSEHIGPHLPYPQASAASLQSNGPLFQPQLTSAQKDGDKDSRKASILPNLRRAAPNAQIHVETNVFPVRIPKTEETRVDQKRAKVHTKKPDSQKEVETDEHKINQRLKQIAFGMFTTGFLISRMALMEAKSPLLPCLQPPNPLIKWPKRGYDNQLVNWKRLLHAFDTRDEAKQALDLLLKQNALELTSKTALETLGREENYETKCQSYKRGEYKKNHTLLYKENTIVNINWEYINSLAIDFNVMSSKEYIDLMQELRNAFAHIPKNEEELAESEVAKEERSENNPEGGKNNAEAPFFPTMSQQDLSDEMPDADCSNLYFNLSYVEPDDPKQAQAINSDKFWK